MLRAKVAHILPATTDAKGGVAEYARHLASGLQSFGIESVFVETAEPYSVFQTLMRGPSDELLAKLLATESNAVLLHYSGYGFSRWGLCFWLGRGLARWKRKSSRNRLISIFHELHINRSNSWLLNVVRRLQVSIGKRIVYLSEAIISTTQDSASRITQWGSGFSVHVLPVFSTVGEPRTLAPLIKRRNEAVIFGSTSSRQRVIECLLSADQALLESIGIDSIAEIGALSEEAPELRVELRRLGVLEDEDVSQELSSSRYGLIDYPQEHIEKSTIFAAYCAHGLCTINTDGSCEGADKIFVGLREADIATQSAAVADNAAKWYAAHAKSRTVHCIADLILGSTTG